LDHIASVGVGQADVHDDHLHPAPSAEQRHGLRAGVRGDHLMTGVLDGTHQRTPDRRLVLTDADRCHPGPLSVRSAERSVPRLPLDSV
jgi:hypothetical protein